MAFTREEKPTLYSRKAIFVFLHFTIDDFWSTSFCRELESDCKEEGDL
jgi:hypothetical protein